MISASVARIEYFFSGFVFSFLKDFITFADVFRIKGNETCGNSSVGRASASQAEGHEFEPRLPLYQALGDYPNKDGRLILFYLLNAPSKSNVCFSS